MSLRQPARVGTPEEMLGDKIRLLPLHELRDHGYLLEANRRFFHPLGLALMVAIDPEDHANDRLTVVDLREDLEGGVMVWQGDDPDAVAKVGMVEAQWQLRAEVREKALGFVVQPPPKGKP